MKIMHLIEFVNSNKGYGVSYDYIKNKFAEEDEEDIKRLISAALDLAYIKKAGKGRGVKYYGIEFDIIAEAPKNENVNTFIDGAIDVSNCLTTKEKIKAVLESTHPLSRPVSFEYRENLLEKTTNRELRDYINDGIADVNVKIIYDNIKKKNYIYSQQNKKKYNQIMIGKNKDGILTVTRIMDGSQSYKEEKTFDDWISLEKYLRTLLPK